MPTALWLYLNRAPPNWDDSWYLAYSLAFYDTWHTGGILGMARAFLESVGFGFRAPLIIALPAPFYWIFGRSWHVAFFVNVAAMAMLFAAVYQIGKLLRNAQAGLMAVYIVGTMPLLYGLARWYMVEYSLTAVVAATFWFALITVQSDSRASAWALGVACGVGLLLKASFPLFVLPVLVYVVFRRQDRIHLTLPILLPSATLAAPWYAYHWRATWDNAIDAGYGVGAASHYAAILTYLRQVAMQGLSRYYLLLAAVACIVAIFQRRFEVFRQIAPLGLWLFSFLIFLFGNNKDVRYIAPVLPAFAVALACILDAAVGFRKWLVAPALIFPYISLLAVSFAWPYSAQDLGYAILYDKNTWGQDEILSAIAADLTYRYGDKKMVLLATDRGHFNVENFQLAAAQRQLPLRLETTTHGESLDALTEQSKGASYIVYKQGGEPESPLFNKFSSAFLEHIDESPLWEEMPLTYNLPDGGVAHILRRR